MQHKYLKILLIATSLLLACMASLNYFVDPAGIYRAQSVSPSRYASELIRSDTGLLWPAGMFEERSLAKALSKHANKHDCVVIGSSHVMQISSFRNEKALKGVCKQLINLGVSGASLEDHFTLAFLSSRKALPNTKFILGVDPWTMTHNMDSRWLEYSVDYEEAHSEIIGALSKESKPKEHKKPSKLANLLNAEYTKRSLVSLKRRMTHGPLQIQKGVVKEEIGIPDPVKLPDGSLIYSSNYIENSKKSSIPIGGSNYKTIRDVSTERGVKEYKALLRWLIDRQHTPVVMMTPYHHNVWKAPDSKNVLAMQKTEEIILSVGKELGIEVIGSYQPEMFGCTEDEFYDFMHPKASCLAKLQPQSKSSNL